MNLSKSKIIPRIYQVFTIATILLSFISYTPITDLNTPSLSTLFFGTIIAVIISKMLAVYSTIIWTMGDDYKTTPQKCFIYVYVIYVSWDICICQHRYIGKRQRTIIYPFEKTPFDFYNFYSGNIIILRIVIFYILQSFQE